MAISTLGMVVRQGAGLLTEKCCLKLHEPYVEQLYSALISKTLLMNAK